MTMKTWAYEQFGNDGKIYNLRIICTDEEKAQLQRVGILPGDVWRRYTNAVEHAAIVDGAVVFEQSARRAGAAQDTQVELK